MASEGGYWVGRTLVLWLGWFLVGLVVFLGTVWLAGSAQVKPGTIIQLFVVYGIGSAPMVVLLPILLLAFHHDAGDPRFRRTASGLGFMAALLHSLTIIGLWAAPGIQLAYLGLGLTVSRPPGGRRLTIRARPRDSNVTES